jgi:hypothetical protein
MIVSVLDSRDLRRPRLAFAIAQVRRRQCRSLALLDATAASSSQWRNQRLAATLGLPKIAVVPAAGRGLQPALDALRSHAREIVIDIDETESCAARSALVAAKVLVVAMPSTDRDDSGLCMALRDRIERARLFNPTLKILLAPVGSDSAHANGQPDSLQRLADSIPSTRITSCKLGDLGRLCALSQGTLDADIERDMAALCAEVFPDGRPRSWRIPQSLRSLRAHAEMAVAAALRRFAIPAGRAGTPPRFR